MKKCQKTRLRFSINTYYETDLFTLNVFLKMQIRGFLEKVVKILRTDWDKSMKFSIFSLARTSFEFRY